MDQIKYVVSPPVEGGYAFWNVTRPQRDGGTSYEEITISKHVPKAESLAYWIAEFLNDTR